MPQYFLNSSFSCHLASCLPCDLPDRRVKGMWNISLTHSSTLYLHRLPPPPPPPPPTQHSLDTCLVPVGMRLLRCWSKSTKRFSQIVKRGKWRRLCVLGPPWVMGNRRRFTVSRRRTYELWKGTLSRCCSWVTLSSNSRETVEDQPSTGHYVQPGVIARGQLVRTTEVALYVTQNKGWLIILGSSSTVVRLQWYLIMT